MKDIRDLHKFRKPTRMLLVAGDDPGQLPITKVGGVPWWPQGTPRPFCVNGHPMTFLAQILLSDVPELQESGNSLLSFHYCAQCAYDGKMSWGWNDSQNRGYDLRFFENPENEVVDNVGELDAPIVQSGAVQFQEALDFPTFDDLPVELHALPELALVDDDYQERAAVEYVNIEGTKVGGWPSWVQDAQWPETGDDESMIFIAQIDHIVGHEAPWAGGGYAYIFASHPSKKPRRAELSVLTT